MKRIVLHVDRLLLHGIAADQAQVLARALQSELQTLFAAPGAIDGLVARDATPVLRVGEARVPHDGNARAVARSMAARLVRGGRP